MEATDVCIRGQGVVGMAAALVLSRAGLSVAVAPPRANGTGQPDVRAYALNAASVRLLESVKVWPALPADARTAVHDMRIEGDAPGAVLDFSAWAQGVGELAWIVDAAELESALSTAVRFAPHVRLCDPNEMQASLQVVAEGRDSPARQRLGVTTRSHPYGHHGLATRVVADVAHAGLARQWFRSPDVLALLPFDRPQAARSYGVVWSLPQDRAEALQRAPAEVFESALADATGLAAGRLTLAGERALWPLSLARSDPLCGRGWVLVGDAAHRVHPLAGQGLNLGLADVASLAQVLSSREPWRAVGDERLLRRHVRAREGPVLAMARLTDGLLGLFSSRDPVLRELRNHGLSLLNQLTPLKRALTSRAIDG